MHQSRTDIAIKDVRITVFSLLIDQQSSRPVRGIAFINHMSTHPVTCHRMTVRHFFHMCERLLVHCVMD